MAASSSYPTRSSDRARNAATQISTTLRTSPPSEPEAYRRDVPNAFIEILEAGHFALDTAADQIAMLIGQFIKIAE
jgi:hypothetical protein